MQGSACFYSCKPWRERLMVCCCVGPWPAAYVQVAPTAQLAGARLAGAGIFYVERQNLLDKLQAAAATGASAGTQIGSNNGAQPSLLRKRTLKDPPSAKETSIGLHAVLVGAQRGAPARGKLNSPTRLTHEYSELI
jgi:hypothetical protein